MSNDTVVSLGAPARVSDPLTELLRTGARRLIEAAVSAEFEEYLSAFVQEQLPDGRQRVVRNGHLPERKILTGLGEVEVRVPKSRSRSGSPEPFRSSVVPSYARVSTTDQDFTIQRGCLYEAGCEKLFAEKISGARKMRPQLERLLTELRTDDVVVVTRLDRLARSTSELLCIAETIEEKNAGLQSIAEPWADTT